MLSLTSCFITLGAFRLLELTGQTNPVAMIISFLFKALQPDQSNPKEYARGKCFFFQQKLLEKAYFILKLTGRAMVRPASSDFWKAPLVLGHHML